MLKYVSSRFLAKVDGSVVIDSVSEFIFETVVGCKVRFASVVISDCRDAEFDSLLNDIVYADKPTRELRQTDFLFYVDASKYLSRVVGFSAVDLDKIQAKNVAELRSKIAGM